MDNGDAQTVNGAYFSFSRDGECLVVIDYLGLAKDIEILVESDATTIKGRQNGRLFLEVEAGVDIAAKFKMSTAVRLVETKPGETPNNDLIIQHVRVRKQG